jgi:hypothetical protein
MSQTLDRREFTVASALALLSGIAVTVSGCGGSGSPAAPTTADGSRTGAISANHGHTAMVTAAQIGAAGALTLDIRGTSDHPHTVVLSAADLAAMGAGQRVSRVSSNDDAHTHTVTFN